MKTLIERGADVNLKNERGTTPLMTAVMSRGSTVEIVKLLLAAGADPDARNSDGETALSLLDVHVTEKLSALNSHAYFVKNSGNYQGVCYEVIHSALS